MIQQTHKGSESFDLDFLCDHEATTPLLSRWLTDDRDGILGTPETIQRTRSRGSGRPSWFETDGQALWRAITSATLIRVIWADNNDGRCRSCPLDC
jgi:hypothetical protein